MVADYFIVTIWCYHLSVYESKVFLEYDQILVLGFIKGGSQEMKD